MSAAENWLDEDEFDLTSNLDSVVDEPDERLNPEPVADQGAPKRKRGRPRKNEDASPRPGKAKAKPTNAPKNNIRMGVDLTKEIEAPLMLAAAMWEMGDPYCGEVARESIPRIAKSLNAWAQSSPQLYKILSAGSQGAGPIGVFMASFPLVVAVVQHHNPAAVAARQEYARQQQEEAERVEYARMAEEETANPEAASRMPFNVAPATPTPGY